MQRITILVLYDGKAGHLSQSLGLANLVAQRLDHPSDIDVVSVRPRVKLLNRPLRCLAQALPPMWARIVSVFYSKHTIANKPDLIVSFGGNVVALNIALHRFWQAPNVLIGNQYGVTDRFISAHLTSSGKNTPNTITSGAVLCKIDRQACHRAGQTLLQNSRQRPYWCLLLGGNGSGYEYQAEDWCSLAAALNDLARRYSIQWLISDSRRTHPGAMDYLHRHLDCATTTAFCRYGEQNQPTIEAVLGASERLFCTEDSLSMLTESTAMNKPVVSLVPRAAKPRPVHKKLINRLQETGLIERQEIASLGEYRVQKFNPVVSYDAQLDTLFKQLCQLTIFNHLQPEHQAAAFTTKSYA